jgi:hypothetical protein
MKTFGQFLTILLATVSILSCGSNKSSTSANIRAAQPQAQTQTQDSDKKATIPSSIEGGLKGKSESAPSHEVNAQAEAQDPTQSQNHSLYASTGLVSVKKLAAEKLLQKNQKKERPALELAQSIENFRITIDKDTHRVFIDLDRNKQKLTLVGILDATGVAFIKPTKRIPLEAKVICLDRIETRCFSTLIELTDTKLAGASAIIISQKTNANFKFKAREETQSNQPLDVLNRYLLNTEKRLDTAQSLRSILVETFEVINGKSATRIAFIARNGEVISFQGPLLKSATDTDLTNIVLDLNYDLEDLNDFERYVGAFKMTLAESLSEIALIQYDTENKMTLSFRQIVQGKSDDALLVELYRQPSQIKTLNQIKLRLGL